MLTISIRTSWDGVRGIARLVMAFAALLLVSSFVAPRAFAQTTGSLEGVVLDTDGLEVPSATVTLTGTNLIGGKQEQATDGAGYYRFNSLLPGLYDITVSKAGFTTTSVKGIQVLINRSVKQDVTLPIGEAAEVVDIVAQQAIDTSSTTVGQVLTKDFLQKIPTGQSYQQAVQLAAGVTGGGNPNMAGGGSNENQYLLDGATVTDPVTGTFSNNFNYDAIQQIDVMLGGYDPEYNTLGGIINLVTDSGTNNLQFNSSVYYGNGNWSPKMDARYTPDGYQLGPTGFDSSLQTLQVRSRVSGPLVRDKAWFIFSYQHDRSLIALTSIPQRRDYDGHYILAKLTVQPNASHRVTLFIQSDPTTIDNISQGNPFQKPEAQGQQAQGGFTAQARWQWFLNEKVNLDTRLQLTKTTIEVNSVPCTHDINADRSHCQPGEEEGAVDYFTPGRSGAFGAYDSVNWGQLYFDDRWRVNAAMKLQVLGVEDPFGGSHDFKFGVEGNQFINNFVQGVAGNTIYVDINEAPFNPETFTNYYWIETTGPISQRNTGSTWNFFAQDAYKPISNLTIRYGFRVDNTIMRNDIGEAVINATAFSPRFYAAWDPFGDQKTKIAGGYGRTVDVGRQEVAGFTSVSTFGQKLYLGEFFNQFDISSIANQEYLSSTSTRVNLNTANDRLRLPSTDEFTLIFQRQLVTDVVFGLQTVARFYRGLFEADDLNLVYDEDGSAIIGSRYVDPFNPYYRLRTMREARRNYYRTDVAINKLRSRRWAGQVVYSYEFLNGTSEESLAGAFVNDPQTRYNYGPLLTQRTHSVIAFGYWDLPDDPWTTTIGFFLNYESGAPLERIYWSDGGVTTGGYGLRIRPRNFYWKFNDFWELGLQLRQKFDVRKGKLEFIGILENMTNNHAPDSISGFLYQENRLFAFSRQAPMRITLGFAYEF